MRFRTSLAVASLLFAACSEPPAPPAGPTVPGTVEVRGADRDLSGQAAWAVDFGSVEPGTVASEAIVLANPGDQPVAVRIEGVTAPFGGAPEELVLRGGEEHTLTLRFAPETWGKASAIATLRWGARSSSILLAGSTPCAVTVAPPSLDFGTVRVGHPVTSSVDVAFSGLGCGEVEGFTLDGDGTIEVEPRHTHNGLTRAEVSWVPQDEGPTAGTLEIKTRDAVHSVPISGRATLHCAELSAERIEFGTVIAGCGYAEQAFELRNDCSHPLEPVPTPWWRTDPPAGFQVDRDPASPASLAPGGTARFIASYQPDDRGYHEGRLRFWEGTEGGAELELAGEAEWPRVTDTFEQPGPPEVLLVVDGSIFVEPYAGRLDTFVGDLVELLGPYEARLGVTSTTLVGTEECPGEDGRLVPVRGSRARLVELDAPDALDQVRAHLADVASCAESSEGAALEAAALALTPPLIDSADDLRHPEPADGNLGLAEHGELFWLLLFSARDELSTGTLDSYAERFRQSPISGGRGVSQGFAPGAAGCGELQPSPRFAELFPGETLTSVCDEDWPIPTRPSIVSSGYAIPPRRFFLAVGPRDLDFDGQLTESAGEIAVAIDGVRIPSGEDTWRYSNELNAVDFASAPHGPLTIEITYIPTACQE